MYFSWKVPKNQIIFGFLYTIFIFSEQIADDESALANLSNKIDALKIKYIMIIFAIGLLLLRYLKDHRRFIQFKDETKHVLYIVAVLFVITLFIQIENGFMESSYNEIFFWLIPIIYVYLLVNNIDNVKRYMDTAFIISFIFFLISISKNLSIRNILAISFVNSNSAFESEYSFYGLVFLIYYMFWKDRTRSILSLIMIILAFKRMAVVFALLIISLSLIQNKKGIFNKQPNRKLVLLITIIFILVPLVFHLICSNEFGNWFYGLTGLDFNAFISGRLERLNLCIDNEMKYGLGSTTQFLNRVWGKEFSRNLHNDILRIYLECGIIGTIAFTYNYFKISSKSMVSFILMIYLFTDMMFNHFLGAGRTAFWIIIYLAIYDFNKDSNGARIINCCR